MEDSASRRKPITYAIVTADIWSNPKICKAGPMGALAFVFALTRNAAHGRLGVFPNSEFEPWYIARQTGLDHAEAELGRSRAFEAGLLGESDGQVCIVGWSEEWKRADLTAAESERKRRYRLKISTDAAPESGKKKNKTRTEKKRVEELGHVPNCPGQVPDKSRTRIATSLNDNWVPTRSESNLKAESEAKASGVDLRTELLNLRDWAKANGTTGKDWDARWRLWIRRSQSATGSKQLRVVGRVEPLPPEAYGEDPLGTRARAAARAAGEKL